MWKRGVVELARLDGSEEVGDAEVRRVALAGEGEAQSHSVVPVVVLPDDEIVAVGVGGEEAVDDLGHQDAGRLGLGELLAQHRVGSGP